MSWFVPDVTAAVKPDAILTCIFKFMQINSDVMHRYDKGNRYD